MQVVLSRMFEDKYITAEELKQAYIDGLNLTFKTSSFSIKAPHFVFWVKELLEENYEAYGMKGKEDLLTKGLIIKTSLDYEIQKQAEKALTDNVRTLYANNATNSAMIYLDTNKGDILAYVGSLDYFNEEIQGQNDMVRKPRQSGSSIKPLIYSLGFQKLPLTIDTPIYDLPFQVGPDRPNNADDRFEGLLPLKYALGHSRNIPAVKMYLAIGGEDAVKPYLQSLGLSSITNDIFYGYPLALGAGEVTMLELAEAYSHLTTQTPATINPILEIRDANGTIIYQKETEEKAELIPEGVKYLMRRILSDPANRLAGRVSKFNVSGLTYALKTGTSNVKTDKGNRPRDGRLAAYTPDNLVLMRAGNANATPMNANAFGGTIHADPIKQFMQALLSNNYISNTQMTNVDTQGISISRITGNLPAEGTPSSLIVSSIGYLAPKKVDDPVTEIEYDAECLGMTSPLTPSEQIRQGYLFQSVSSFMPGQEDAQDIQNYLTASARGINDDTGSRVSLSSLRILFEAPKDYCANREPALSEDTSITFLNPQDDRRISEKSELMVSVKSDGNLKTLSAQIDDVQVRSKTYTTNTRENIASTILDLSQFSVGTHTITVQATNTKGGMNRASINVVLQTTDKTPPYLMREQSKVTQKGDKREATLIFNDELSAITSGAIMAGESTILSCQGRMASFTTSEPVVDIFLKDAYENELRQTLDLSAF